jgi:DNA modification methylase
MPRSRRSLSSATSAFGSPGRISHNADRFYNSRLYKGIVQENEGEYVEIPFPIEHLNHIFPTSAEEISQLPDNCIHLMITSPPYNVGKEYDDDLTLDEYLQFLSRIWYQVFRVLVPGGRACVNLANLGRKPYIPLHAFIIQEMLKMGFLMRGEIIWNKAASASASTAWGSWCSATNPTLRDVHEYILVFSKGTFRRKSPTGRQSTITKDEFLEYSKSVWNFPAESARKIGHPAPFPVELPYRLIQLYSFSKEVVLDPFMGSGQTAIAALSTDRYFLGYEIEPNYVDLCEKRIRRFVEKDKK